MGYANWRHRRYSSRYATNHGWRYATHTYPNAQDAALAWYHDHALGITRLNVYAGGAGGYIITDDVEEDYIQAGPTP